MDVFEFRERLVGEYGQFTRSFTRISSEDIARFVTSAYESQRYWPAPLVQVNPNFKTGHSVEELVAAGSLHPECARIFRGGKSLTSAGVSLRLFQHQQEAISFAQTGASYALTTALADNAEKIRCVPASKKPSSIRPTLSSLRYASGSSWPNNRARSPSPKAVCKW